MVIYISTSYCLIWCYLLYVELWSCIKPSALRDLVTPLFWTERLNLWLDLFKPVCNHNSVIISSYSISLCCRWEFLNGSSIWKKSQSFGLISMCKFWNLSITLKSNQIKFYYNYTQMITHWLVLSKFRLYCTFLRNTSGLLNNQRSD